MYNGLIRIPLREMRLR